MVVIVTACATSLWACYIADTRVVNISLKAIVFRLSTRCVISPSDLRLSRMVYILEIKMRDVSLGASVHTEVAGHSERF